jgi:hypothetical protein
MNDGAVACGNFQRHGNADVAAAEDGRAPDFEDKP